MIFNNFRPENGPKMQKWGGKMGEMREEKANGEKREEKGKWGELG